MHTFLARTPRRRRRWLAAPLLVAVLTASGCFGGGGGTATDLLARVNQVRSQAGLPALTWCPTLANAATRHATDMATNGVRGHTGSDGSTFDQRIRGAGYLPGFLVAENVGWGQSSVEEVLEDWMDSPTHRDNILRPGLEHAGFARVGNNWVQNFGAVGAC